MWDEKVIGFPDKVAIAPQQLARAAAKSQQIANLFMFLGTGSERSISSPARNSQPLAVHKYEGEFENALDMMRGRMWEERVIPVAFTLSMRIIFIVWRSCTGQPDNGPPTTVKSQCRLRNKWYAYDVESRLRDLGRKYCFRKYLPETQYEHHLGFSSRSCRYAISRRVIRRIL
ncbi:hypothetical protein [Aminivibrio sp.]|uniref:hypothetical protein n=1 Tax=Aminivibrio sp. TaxID=1872489 RepID=UPI00345E7F60